MGIIITPHASERAQKYGLNHLQVRECILAPDVVVCGNFGRKIANRRIDSHYVLRVIYEEQGNDIVAVTVYKARVGRYEI